MGLRLENIPKPRIKANRKRKGRGIGSGRGKTSGKGHKGAKARSGGGTYNPGFEGGQMPVIRRMPKRGFTNKFRKEWNVINTGKLQSSDKISSGMVIDRKFFIENRLVHNSKFPIKLLGKGILEKELTVEANAFSAGARKAIEDAGGKVVVVPLKAAELKEGAKKTKRGDISA